MSRRPVTSSPSPVEHDAHGPAAHVPLAIDYAGLLGGLGVYGSFLAVYLRHRGLEFHQVAYLLSLLPLARLISTPFWALVADKSNSAGGVLRLLCAGALLGFVTLELRPSLLVSCVALVAFTFFRAPCAPLIDVLVLSWAERNGRHLGTVRAWGTLCYAVCTFGVGLLVDRVGPNAVLHVAVSFLLLTFVATFGIPLGGRPAGGRVLPALWTLFRRPRVLVFLCTTLLHQVGLAAYDSLYAAHVAEQQSPVYAGAALAVGACAEVLVLAKGQKLLGWRRPQRLLVLVYAASFLRWLGLAYGSHPAAIILLQVIQGLTFGAFYLAAVAWIHEESPLEIRASAQGGFNLVTFGIGTTLAVSLAGWLHKHGGMQRVFLVAACASLAATLIVAGLSRASPPAEGLSP
jgi:PPP family 3-phenylpropionic acid transporter